VAVAGHGRRRLSTCESGRIWPIHHYRPRNPQPFTMPYLILRAAGIPPAARMLSRIPRGFLEREAYVKQTHRFR
jgi:hypothetical protein